jgi:hypothetical protein
MRVLRGPLQNEGALVEVLVGWSAAGAQQQRAALRPVTAPLGYQALIGRDVLARIRFLYDGPKNSFGLAY